jgi:hypothetical protein
MTAATVTLGFHRICMGDYVQELASLDFKLTRLLRYAPANEN